MFRLRISFDSNQAAIPAFPVNIYSTDMRSAIWTCFRKRSKGKAVAEASAKSARVDTFLSDRLYYKSTGSRKFAMAYSTSRCTG